MHHIFLSFSSLTSSLSLSLRHPPIYIEIYASFAYFLFCRLNSTYVNSFVATLTLALSHTRKLKRIHRCHLNWLLLHVPSCCYCWCFFSDEYAHFHFVCVVYMPFSLTHTHTFDFGFELWETKARAGENTAATFKPWIASNMSLSINNDLINLLIESSIEASKTQ